MSRNALLPLPQHRMAVRNLLNSGDTMSRCWFPRPVQKMSLQLLRKSVLLVTTLHRLKALRRYFHNADKWFARG